MSDQTILIQPGPIFWEVFRGAMTSHGIGVTKWGADRGLAVASLKPMATGATNGKKSKEVRELMIEAVGRDTFQDLYVKHLKHEVLWPS